MPKNPFSFLHVFTLPLVAVADQPQAEVVHAGALWIRLLRLSQQRLSFTGQNGKSIYWENSPEKISTAQYVSRYTENSCYEDKMKIFFTKSFFQ